MNQNEQILEACLALKEIGILESVPEFQGFMEKLRNMSDKLAESVLHDDDLSPEGREALRNERKGILSVLRLPAEIRIGQQSVLNAAGVTLEDQLPEGS